MTHQFRHKAIYGQTGSGKTWLLKRVAKSLLKHRSKVIVWTGVGDNDFPKGCKVTYSVDELEAWLGNKDNYGAHIMLDEASILIDDASSKKDYPNIHKLFQAGRHKGYTAYMATQYPTSVPRKWRVNCSECYCFLLGDEESAKLVWADYNRQSINGVPAWKLITSQKQLNAIHFIQPDTIKKIEL